MLSKQIAPLLSLPRYAKRLMVLTLDTCMCVFTVWLGFSLRLGEFYLPSQELLLATVVSVALALPLFIRFGFYRAIFRYSGWSALGTVAKVIFFYGLAYASIFTLYGFSDIPRTTGLIQPILLFLFVGISRAVARYWLGGPYMRQLRRLPKVLIYGAGKAGRQFAEAMTNSTEIRVIGFLDDDDRLHNHVLNGLPIYAPAQLSMLKERLDVNEVLLALPSVSRKRRHEIINNILHSKVSVKTLPSLTHIAQGKLNISDITELEIDDLLGRDTVAPQPILLAKNTVNKVVLVSGAGGSIGSELCRQIWKIRPTRLLLVEQNEFALYRIHQELTTEDEHATAAIIPLLASVSDRRRMADIIATWRPDTIYHAAAYKHVPLVEHNPAEGIRNNVFGTHTIAELAMEHGVQDFVLISTDKAVRPTNIMGASKRLAEMVLQAIAARSTRTRFSMVRFGNVLGSSGSVVPLFRQQIKDGGPITLTHPNITRYFMTIPEAAQLVIQAGAMAKGGDVFVLDMGQPVKIFDLAVKMIELSGLSYRTSNNDGDIAIKITGLRPGEKLYEELLIGENPQATSHVRIMKAREDFLEWPQLQPLLNTLETAVCANDIPQILTSLQELVAGYRPNGAIVDWVYLAKLSEYG